VDAGGLHDLGTQHDPWWASTLAWRTRADDNGLLGAGHQTSAPGGLALALGIHTRGEPHYKFRHLHRKVPPMAKPGPHGKDKQRCGARVRHRHGFCRNWPVPGKERCRLHGGLSTGALTDEGKARSLAAMRAGRQRWHEGMRAKKAAGEIKRFPGGRKSGARWITPRMRELRQIEAMRRVQDARDARPPSPPRRRGRPTIIARAQAQILRTLAQLPKSSPWLASLAPHHLARVAEARRDLERRARRTRPRPDF
jgi:hypothetical protein